MLCGHCGKPVICEVCDEEEYSPEAWRNHEFRPSKCECEKIDTYIGKDTMWYIKSIFEVFLLAIFLICLFGFIISFLVLCCVRIEWLNNMIGYFVPVGVCSIFFLAAWDGRWREDYKERVEEFVTERRSKEDRKQKVHK